MLIWVASGVARATAFLRKHLTWFLAYFEHAYECPTDCRQALPLSRYGRHHNTLGTALVTDVAVSI